MGDRLLDIIQCMASGESSEADLAALRQLLASGDARSLSQLGKYNVHIGEGRDIHVGDRTYIEIDDEAVRAIAAEIQRRSRQVDRQSLEQLDFQGYLRSLVETYQEWWQRYTLTEAIGRSHQKEDKTERDRPVFEFGLMVQTVQKEKEPPESQQEKESETEKDEREKKEREKIERLPVLEGIRKYADGHVLLRGRPGSGKSTALIRLLLESATMALEQGEGQIPILVELRYWQTSLLERIRAFLCKHDPKLDLDDVTLARLLRQGRFLLLIDGLNELPSEAARQDVARFEKDFIQAPMIFTTRKLSLVSEIGLEKKLEMQPLTEAQIRQFVGNYLGQERGKKLLGQLQNRLRELGQTPLLLAMLCSIFASEQALPTNLGEVFRQFTQFYEQRLKGDVPDPYEYRDDWAKLLQCLAFAMMQGPDPQQKPTELSVAISKGQAERLLIEFLRDREPFPAKVAERCLKDLLKHHLIQTNGEQIEFRHQLIQEYYAAEKLLRLLPELSDEQLKQGYLNYLKWTEPVALMLALVNEEAQALRVVKLAMDDVDLMLGARLVGEVQAIYQTTTVSWLDRLNNPLLIQIQCWAISGSAAAIPGLLKAIEHQDSSVRWRATEALGKLGSEAAIPALLKAIEDQEYYVRRSAAEALGKLGSEAAIPALLKAIEDQDSSVRRRATEALGELGSEAAIPALLKVIEHQDSDVRRRAAEALGELGSEAAIPALLKVIEHQDSYVRRKAAEALAQLGSEAAIPALLKVIEHQDSYVRRRAAEALARLGSEAAIPGLLKAIEDQDYYVRGRAAEALGELGSEATIPALFKAIEHQDSFVRRSTAEALARLGSEAAIPELLKAIEDQNVSVRRSAAEALGHLGGESVAIALTRVLETRGVDLREIAIEALGRIADEDSLTPLTKALIVMPIVKALQDKYPVVRRKAVEALERIGTPQPLAMLWQQQLTSSGTDIYLAITAIQNRCKFYNYEIWQDAKAIQKTSHGHSPAKPESQNGDADNKSETHPHFYGTVHGVAGNVEGDQNILPPHSIN